jgi:hypothetical protein
MAICGFKLVKAGSSESRLGGLIGRERGVAMMRLRLRANLILGLLQRGARIRSGA